MPSIVKRGLPSLNIVAVQDMGWAGIKNGKLLRLVADEFERVAKASRDRF